MLCWQGVLLFTDPEQEALPQQNQILKSVVEKETEHVTPLLS